MASSVATQGPGRHRRLLVAWSAVFFLNPVYFFGAILITGGLRGARAARLQANGDGARAGPCSPFPPPRRPKRLIPKLLEQLEKFGIANRVVSFVLPLGYSFNLDGSMMYCTFAAMFIAQANGLDIPIAQQLVLMALLFITSKGIAGRAPAPR